MLVIVCWDGDKAREAGLDDHVSISGEGSRSRGCTTAKGESACGATSGEKVVKGEEVPEEGGERSSTPRSRSSS